MKKLQIEIEGRTYPLQVKQNGNGSTEYLAGDYSGSASVVELMPGVFSVLDGTHSHTVHVTGTNDGFEIWADARRLTATVTDDRDRSARAGAAQANGRLELRTQMPGKVVKVLVHSGMAVHAGQGLVVVEAMKMQNEVKAPRDGVVGRIAAVEGATVGANEMLVVLE